MRRFLDDMANDDDNAINVIVLPHPRNWLKHHQLPPLLVGQLSFPLPGSTYIVYDQPSRMRQTRFAVFPLVVLTSSTFLWFSTDGFVALQLQPPSHGSFCPPWRNHAALKAPPRPLPSASRRGDDDDRVIVAQVDTTSLDATEDAVYHDLVNPGAGASNSSFVLYRPDEEEESCLPPGQLPKVRLVFLISDATGVTARSTLLKSLAQFDTCADENSGFSSANDGGGIYATTRDDRANPAGGGTDAVRTTTSGAITPPFGGTCDVRTRTFTFIRSTETLTQILETAGGRDACVMYTLADPQLRATAGRVCSDRGIPHVDLMGGPLDVLSGFLDKTPLGIPARLSTQTRRRSYLGDSYYQRIDAVEFALKADDGQSPWLLPEADIVLVGVSRSGKTPLSVVLSQTMSLKVANIPLVMEVAPPKELLSDQVDPRRVFCLTIAPSELRKIRTSRLERRGIRDMEAKMEQRAAAASKGGGVGRGMANAPPKSNYADRNYLTRDLAHARQWSQKYNWTEIDVTGRAVEETATYIVEIFNERFGRSVSSNHLG
jgi:regulator of PEP synthase PpsR (kinase-PPPase family)